MMAELPLGHLVVVVVVVLVLWVYLLLTMMAATVETVWPQASLAPQ
jgi:hypothetical protein